MSIGRAICVNEIPAANGIDEDGRARRLRSAAAGFKVQPGAEKL